MISSFNTDGYTLTGSSTGEINDSGFTEVGWTFRKQPKFFDVVTYTGNGTAGRTVAHSLGSIPGCVIVKHTSAAGSNWKVYHRSLGGTKFINLSATTAAGTNITYWNNTDPTSTVFTVGDDASVNQNGVTFVAYVFAHDSGGFGLTGTDNVISCGAFSTDAGGKATVNLGYEPQWVMFKRTDSATFGNWYMIDNMRGFTNPSGSSWLWANATNAEQTGINFAPESTGFNINFTGPADFIYIAIRRGPMKVPTDATKVFAVDTDRNATKPGFTSNFPVDFVTRLYRLGGANMRNGSRLTGANHLESNTTAAEVSDSEMTWDYMTGWGNDTGATSSIVSHMFRRAPSFFDEVCYTGTGVARSINHNLGVAPELMISKTRGTDNSWQVWTKYYSYLSGTAPSDNCTGVLNYDNAFDGYSESSSINALPTASVFSLGTQAVWNGNGNTAVMYLFATCAGVSKVGSYTGTATTQVINCGFTGGARFVLIRRTDSTGNWYVWDTARGMVVGTDPSLLLNSTAAEVNANSIYTATGGFQIVSTAAGINASGGSFIFFAVA
jgi:hypothetical protein